MKRKDRLMATLGGQPVDRPAVSFYEINGLDEHPEDPDSYNIYQHPSWLPLIELARNRSDRIVMRHVPFLAVNPLEPLIRRTFWEERDARFEKIEIQASGRSLTQVTRRDRDVNTIWVIEHLLKDVDDLKAYLDLPWMVDPGGLDPQPVLSTEMELGDSGIVMIDSGDPLCQAASLFEMGTYTVIATQEPFLFQRLLDRFAALLLPHTEAVARALPGRLWRIYGPEYASPPYLNPRLFHEYVTRYDREMVASIQRYGGYARIHSHGRLRLILDEIASMECAGLDPVEPPPQGDMELHEVRAMVGDRIVLFGNLEASDLETLPRPQFREKVCRALREGTGGRGFVLMPSSCPYGRELSAVALDNYKCMVEEVEQYG